MCRHNGIYICLILFKSYNKDSRLCDIEIKPGALARESVKVCEYMFKIYHICPDIWFNSLSSKCFVKKPLEVQQFYNT